MNAALLHFQILQGVLRDSSGSLDGFVAADCSLARGHEDVKAAQQAVLLRHSYITMHPQVFVTYR
jgi:hypothetical protein